MTKKELSELKRRIKPDGNAIVKIHTCFVNETRDLQEYNQVSVALMTQEENVMFMKLLKKVFSGTEGRNLLDIEFETKQVADSEEHRLLMKLRDSKLEDAEARSRLFRNVIAGLPKDENAYLILAAFDVYDVPYKTKDGMELSDGSNEIFPYYMVAACPVKNAAVELRYDIEQKEFHAALSSRTVSSPEFGFVFPCFDDRRSNIYNALYYVRNQAEIHEEFIETMFHTEAPMTAPDKKEAFGHAIEDALGDACSVELVQSMQEQLRSRIELHKEEKMEEKLLMSPREVGELMKDTGVPEEKIQKFTEGCKEKLGDDSLLEPALVMDCKKFEVKTPEIKITVAPENAWMIETRVIDSKKYILIPADAGAEVNGINVEVTGDTAADAGEKSAE